MFVDLFAEGTTTITVSSPGQLSRAVSVHVLDEQSTFCTGGDIPDPAPDLP